MGTFVENLNAVAGVITSGVLDPNAAGYSNAIIATEQANIATSMAGVCTSIYDQFDDRYLGIKPTPPTLDNDGNPLVYGALYFDTTNNLMKVWSNAGWVSAGSSVNGTTERYVYTAIAGQTSFTANYESGYVDVYLNGSKLQTGVDFTAASGTAIVLTSSANVGDIVDIIAYGVFEVANTTPKGNEAYTVSTVADLASVPSSYTTAIVKDLDRGGTFIWNSTGTANGGTVFAGATGYWNRQYSGAVNVKWFGAKGDGLTDDTTAIQNAKNTGESVYVPYGVYVNTLSIELLQGQEFFGDGKNSTISMSTDHHGHLIGIIGTTGSPRSNCHIHDIAFDCNSVVNLNGVGIAFAENNIVSNVWVFNAGRKAYTLQYEVFNNIISDCYGDGGASTFPIISLEDPTDTGKCSRNIITNISLGVCMDYVVSLVGATDNIIDNIICESSLRGIALTKSDYNIIENLSTSCTNALFSLNDANNNKFKTIRNKATSIVAIFGFATAISSNNEFNQITANGTSTIIPYGNLSISNKWRQCILSTTYSAAQAIGFGASSLGNKIDECTLSNAGNRVIILDSSNNIITNNSIVAPSTAIQIGAVDGTIIRGNSISGATAGFATEGTTHTNTVLIENKKVNGAIQVAVDTVQINNSWNSKIMYNSTAPLTGTFKVGDVVYSTAPIAGGTIGWVCTTAGTSGTWKTFGSIGA